MPTDPSTLSDARLFAAEDGLHKLYAVNKAALADTSMIEEAYAALTAEMAKRELVFEPLFTKAAPAPSPTPEVERYTPHVFEPLTKDAADGDGDDDEDEADTDPAGKGHAFVPVRNICRHCRMGAETHVAKAVGLDGSIFKAVSDDTIEDRQGGADAGLALPDGSFYIPDEAHLHQAIRLVGQAPDPAAAMNHIIERAQAMGLESALPPAWRAATMAGQPGAPQVGPGAHSLGGAPAPGGKPGAPGAPKSGGSVPPGAPGLGGSTAPGAAPASAPSPGNVAQGGAPPAAPGAPPAPDPNKPNLMKRIAKAVGFAMGAQFDEDAFVKALDMNLDPDFEYAVVKSAGEERYTLGPVYMPNTLDAHGEWTTPEDLQKSMWDYVADTGANREVHLQHSPQVAGHWVEVVAWPQAVTTRMLKSVDGVQKSIEQTFPAGTVYMGVKWEPWAYEDVKKGFITGFSMGGRARRIEADIPV